MTDATGPTNHSHQDSPSSEEFEDIQRIVQGLRGELAQIEESLAREQRKQTSRLEEEHEQWAPLIQDAKARLGTSTAATEELRALEEEENQGRTAIRREFKKRTEALLEMRAEKEDQLARQRSFLASVRKLVDDALLEIFEYFISAGGSPWVLAHTYSRWRRVVLSSNHLWSGILITTNIDTEVVRRHEGKEVCNSLQRLEQAIKRVGCAPIDLSISLNWSHSALTANTASAMITRMASTCAQWRTLHVENSEKVISGDGVFPSHLFTEGFPNLTRASFHMQHHNHGKPSRGLLPFHPFIDIIGSTSEKLRSVHFHGYGHNELTDSYFSSPTKIEDLFLVHIEPRYIQKAHTALMNACPTSRVGWRYSTFVGVDDINPAAALGGATGFIEPNRRIILHGNIHEALQEIVVKDLRIFDIITTSALTLSRPLYLPRVYQLAVYSEDLEELRFINAPILDNLKIKLTSKEIHHVRASRWALERLWVRGTTPHPVRLTLEGVCLARETLHLLATHNPRLRHVRLVDVVPDRNGFLLGLSKAALRGLKIVFTDRLHGNELERLCTDIRSLIIAAKDSGRAPETVTLVHGDAEEAFDPATI